MSREGDPVAGVPSLCRDWAGVEGRSGGRGPGGGQLGGGRGRPGRSRGCPPARLCGSPLSGLHIPQVSNPDLNPNVSGALTPAAGPIAAPSSTCSRRRPQPRCPDWGSGKELHVTSS